MSKPTTRSKLYLVLFLLFCTVLLALSVHGLSGNPTPEQLNTSAWREDGPMELSPERGRFALLYSVVEDKSLYFSTDIARFVTPDLGYFNGRYVSLFAPAVSFIAVPGYVLGKAFGASQVGAFAVISLFALLNVFLIRTIAIRLGANNAAASIAAAIFLFATPAFSYATTLYQHHISVSLLLLGLYALLRWNNFWSLALIWFLCAASIAVDNPNAIFMAPLAIAALLRIFDFGNFSQSNQVTVKPLWLLTAVGAILPLLFFFWFNASSNGSPFRVSGTVESVKAIDAAGNPTQPPVEIIDGEPVEKTSIGFFETRNLLNGFYIHTISFDRGVVFFAPVILLGIIGLIYLGRRNNYAAAIIGSSIVANVLLYSMWGDPEGGWAFGSRYLIPTYALLAICLAYLLTYWRRNYFFHAALAVLVIYSVWVNALGALSTNLNPPQREILGLEEITKREEKYTFERNADYLAQNKSKSFVFQVVAKPYVTASTYHKIVVTVTLGGILSMLGYHLWQSRRKESNPYV